MLKRLNTILHPAHYQGRGKRSPYFEGWYFKLVDATGQYRYAVIPAVFLTAGHDEPHAFIQVFDAVYGRMNYVRYPLTDFSAATDRFEVKIGPNVFSADFIQLDIHTESLSIEGQVCFEDVKPWPVTWTSPGVMGWYAWVPGMECYHGVVSLDHSLLGTLNIDGCPVTFDGGRGYIEKDWGKSFPSGWIWLHTNHFDIPGTSLMGSIARVPWVGRSFPGFFAGLLHQGILYRFTTYTGAKTVHLEATAQQIHWVLEDELYRLEIAAERAETVDLLGPSLMDMGIRVPETLNAHIAVSLSKLGSSTVLYAGMGRNAGLEVAGDIGKLLVGGH
ncbi:MAG: hypothetical protein JW981_02500 [Anaerolineae bacterium]|nr:hypothetical protein [Anaerolineae bacterium]